MHPADYYGNSVHFFMIQQPHAGLSVTSYIVVETFPPPSAENSMSRENASKLIAEHQGLGEGDAGQHVFESRLIINSAEM